MSDVDPDIEAAFNSTPAPASPSSNVDPDVAAAFTSSGAQSKSGRGGAETGAAEMALHYGTGALASIPAAVAYMGHALGIGKGTLENARAVQQAMTYQPRTVGGQRGVHSFDSIAGVPGKWTQGQLDQIEPSGQLSAAVSDLGERTADVAPLLAEGIAAFRGGGITRGVLGDQPTEGPETSEPHPLQAVADQETDRISSSLQAGRDKGMTLPERIVSPNQRAANGIVQDDLKLAPGSPITPAVLDAARKQWGAPAYQAVEKVPSIKLGSAYEEDIGNVDTSLIKDKYRPPAGGELTGSQAVALSKYLREKASSYFQEGSVEATEKGQAHWDAAQAVEDAVERRLKATGQGQLATDWDNARTYYAKTYSVQSALDGAGNVVVPKLKTQLIRGKPLSGGLEDLATMGAANPEAFKSSPMAPQVGIGRRILARALPIAGGAAGAALGSNLGPWGASLGGATGVEIAQNAAQRIASR